MIDTTELLLLSLIASLGLLILWHLPELGISLYLFNGIYKTAPLLATVDSIVPTLFIVLLTVSLLLIRGPAIKSKQLSIDGLLLTLVAFNFLLLLSAFGVSQLTDKAMRLAFFTASSLVMAGVVMREPERLLRAFRLIAMLGIITAALSTVNFAFIETNQIRSVTLFGANDVIHGRSIGLGIIISIGLLLYDNSLPRFWRWVCLLGLPISLINLILSTSRGSIVGVVASLLFVLFTYRARLPRGSWLGLLFIWPLYQLVISVWGNRVIDLQILSVFVGGELDLSSRLRLLFYQQAWERFIASPLIGTGAGSNLYYPHNLFLEVASDLGIIGLCCLFLIIWHLVYNIRRLRLHQTVNQQQVLINLIIVGLIYGLVIAQFSGNLQHQRELWMFVALGWAVMNNPQFTSIAYPSQLPLDA